MHEYCLSSDSSPPMLILNWEVISNYNTGLPAYSDRAGTAKKCHCNQKAPYCVTVSKPFFYYKKPILKSEKCHCNQKALYCVTVTGVTVSGEACIFLTYNLGLHNLKENPPSYYTSLPQVGSPLTLSAFSFYG